MIYYKDYGITKEEALKALFDYSTPLTGNTNIELSLKMAEKYLNKTNSFNFIFDRAIKTTFEEEGFEELIYDCNNGIYAAKNALKVYVDKKINVATGLGV